MFYFIVVTDYISLLWLLQQITILDGLKQQEFILSQLRRPDVQNQYHWAEIRCQQVCAPSRGSRGASVPCLFPLLVAAGIPWLPHSNFCFCYHIA